MGLQNLLQEGSWTRCVVVVVVVVVALRHFDTVGGREGSRQKVVE